MNATLTTPCSASYACGNQTANSTIFGCSQTGKFASLTSCNEYNTCRLLTDRSTVLIVKKCPGRSLFNNVVKLCMLSSTRACGNVTYIPTTTVQWVIYITSIYCHVIHHQLHWKLKTQFWFYCYLLIGVLICVSNKNILVREQLLTFQTS